MIPGHIHLNYTRVCFCVDGKVGKQSSARVLLMCSQGALYFCYFGWVTSVPESTVMPVTLLGTFCYKSKQANICVKAVYTCNQLRS